MNEKTRHVFVKLLCQVLLCGLLVSISTGCSAVVFLRGPVSDIDKRMCHERYGYCLNYPNSWTAIQYIDGSSKDTNKTGLVFFFRDNKPGVNIYRYLLTDMSTPEVLDWTAKRLEERYEDLRYREQSVDIMADADNLIAVRTFTTVGQNALSVTNKEAYLVYGQELYILQFVTETPDFEKHVVVFDEIVESFTVHGIEE